jgi:acyl-CoA synthetase (NDP forming)
MRVLIQQNAVGGIALHLAVVFGSALELGKLFFLLGSGALFIYPCIC